MTSKEGVTLPSIFHDIAPGDKNGIDVPTQLEKDHELSWDKIRKIQE